MTGKSKSDVIREFAAGHFSNGEYFKTGDIYDYMVSQGVVVEHGITMQNVSNALRSWAQGKSIHYGHTCSLVHEDGKRDRFAFNPYNGRGEAEKPKDADCTTGRPKRVFEDRGNSFNAKIVAGDLDGVAVVEAAGRLFSVKPIG